MGPGARKTLSFLNHYDGSDRNLGHASKKTAHSNQNEWSGMFHESKVRCNGTNDTPKHGTDNQARGENPSRPAGRNRKRRGKDLPKCQDQHGRYWKGAVDGKLDEAISAPCYVGGIEFQDAAYEHRQQAQ